MQEEQSTVEKNEKETRLSRFFNWISDNHWLLILGACCLALVGLAMPLVRPHPITSISYEVYEGYVYWSFDSASRVDLAGQILFGIDSAVVWPTLICYCMIVLGAILAIFGKKKASFYTASMILLILGGILLLISAPFYGYANALSEWGKYASIGGDKYDFVSGYINEADARLEIGAIWSSCFAFVGAFIAFSGAFAQEKLSVRDMTEIAMLSAAAIILDVIFHYIPDGNIGSISLAALPLFIIALRHGPAQGFMAAGIIYGLITCFTDGYGLYLYPLDYLVAFGGIGVLGFFRGLILGKGQNWYNVKGEIFIFVGVLLAAFVRLVGSGASSIINYGYSFSASMIYNIPYIFISDGLCAAVLMGAYGPLARMNAKYPIRHSLGE